MVISDKDLVIAYFEHMLAVEKSLAYVRLLQGILLQAGQGHNYCAALVLLGLGPGALAEDGQVVARLHAEQDEQVGLVAAPAQPASVLGVLGAAEEAVGPSNNAGTYLS